MKKFLSLSICLVLMLSLISCGKSDNSGSNTTKKSTTTATKNNNFEKPPTFTLGWNLGNTLDACQVWGDISDHPTPEEQETGWNNPLTTQEIVDKVANTGFDCVRVPVTWGLQLEEDNGKYTIKKDWLDRVKEVVDYCVKADTYVIVNMHHDDQSWLNISANDSDWKKIKDKYKQIWEQIAEKFKDYDEHLILEAANEITATTKFDGCGDSDTDKCWWGHNQEAFDRINELYKIFVDTVRSTGENNSKRYLMLPTYGAQWYDNQIDKLVIPNNDKHIIMDIHWYQADFYDKEKNRWVFELLKNYRDKNGISVILGETGVQKANTSEKNISFGENVVKLAEEYNIPVCLWDDGGDMQLLDRRTLKWNDEKFINGLF